MAEFSVDVAAAGSGGKALEAVADEVDGAHQAGLSAQLNTGAYGVLCQFIPALLKPVQDAACSALREEAVSLRASSAGLAKAQAYYSEADEQTASAYQGVTG